MNYFIFLCLFVIFKPSVLTLSRQANDLITFVIKNDYYGIADGEDINDQTLNINPCFKDIEFKNNKINSSYDTRITAFKYTDYFEKKDIKFVYFNLHNFPIYLNKNQFIVSIKKDLEVTFDGLLTVVSERAYKALSEDVKLKHTLIVSFSDYEKTLFRYNTFAFGIRNVSNKQYMSINTGFIYNQNDNILHFDKSKISNIPSRSIIKNYCSQNINAIIIQAFLNYFSLSHDIDYSYRNDQYYYLVGLEKINLQHSIRKRKFNNNYTNTGKGKKKYNIHHTELINRKLENYFSTFDITDEQEIIIYKSLFNPDTNGASEKLKEYMSKLNKRELYKMKIKLLIIQTSLIKADLEKKYYSI